MGHVLCTLILLILGVCSAFAALYSSLPLPFLLGPLLASSLVATLLPSHLPASYQFPPKLRIVFIAVIGLMIGAQVTPDLFSDAAGLVLSFAALIAFVVLAHGFGYVVLRYLGGYDGPTAFYGAAPGGLFESIAMGEDAGADPARLMLQQFLRVVAVVALLPIGLSLWLGAPVGSAAGMTLARPDVPWSVLPWVVLACGAGIAVGHVLRLPARQLTGPMAVAAALSLSGVFNVDVPQWLVDAAQVVVGTALGMRFTGLTKALMLKGMWLTALCVGGMLVIASGFALVLMTPLDQPFDVLLISFAPGGVTEMSLVALSLSANPAFVTLHHIIRILITVIGLGLSARWLRTRL